MSKIRIAVIGLKGLPAYGGAARSMESIIGYIVRDFDFTIYAIDSHTKVRGMYNGYNQIIFKSMNNKLLNTFMYYWKCLTHVMLKGTYDLILMNHAESGFIIPFLRLKYRVITTLHGVYTNERFEDKFGVIENKLFKVFQWFAFRFSNHLISVSQYEMDFCKKFTNAPISYIPNGVNLNELISDKAIGSSDYLLFAAARVYGIKGADIFLKALKKMNYQGQILFIGDLSHDAKYAKYLKNISENLNIEYLDIIRDKSLLFKYIDSAQLFIFPSRIEAMSNMLLEVASLKCPIIASDIPANSSVFNDREVTFFNSEDHLDLANKIQYSLSNPKVLKAKATRAYEKIQKGYLWEQSANKYKNLINEYSKYKRI